MGVFPNRRYQPSGGAGAGGPTGLGARYRAQMARHPFLLFGLPFLSVVVGASFVLTPATAIRYERHDRRVRTLTRDEELGVGRAGRKVDVREEYFRLAAKDNDNWEQKRVKRLKGESDGLL